MTLPSPTPDHRPARKLVQDLYIRMCRDSGFKLDHIRAAHFVAEMLGISALEVWMTMDMDIMERIANGTHPAARKVTQ